MRKYITLHSEARRKSTHYIRPRQGWRKLKVVIFPRRKREPKA